MAKDRESNPYFRGLIQSLVILVLLQAGLGIYLGTRYDPSLRMAYASVDAMRGDPLSNILVGVHHWGSALLLALAGFAVLGLAWSGAALQSKATWFGALFVAASSYGLQVTGNLLPMDRHDVQTVAVEAGVASRTPLVGDLIARGMLQGDRFNEGTLTAWWTAHQFVLPALAGLGVLLLLPGFWKLKGSLWIALFPSAMAFALGTIFSAPTGDMATAADFTSQQATVSWYAWPLHGALKAFDAWTQNGWIGASLLPMLFGGFLVALPWIGKKLGLGGTRLVLSLMVGLFTVCGLLYAGAPILPAGNQDRQLPTESALQGSGGDAGSIDAELARKGLGLFQRVGCAGCHGMNGEGTLRGPNLENLHLRKPDPAMLAKFIRKPDSVMPGSTMQPFPKLSDEELQAIIEWLRSSK